MPELPEVETVRRTLMPHVVGRQVRAVVIREHRLRRHIDRRFARDLTGRTIGGIRRVGKYLLFDLDGGFTWIVHLGMTGCLAVGQGPEGPHTHVGIALSDGTVLSYHDPRRFGLMRLVSELPDEVTSLGVDPLGEAFTAEQLRCQCRGRKRPIKTLLMDQRIVAGIGNIYASEILHRAGVRPSRRSGRLTRRETEAIYAATRQVLGEAIAVGGSSVSDYRDGEGQAGSFQLQLRVYDRGGEPCGACGALIREKALAGRSSFYCPHCQP